MIFGTEPTATASSPRSVSEELHAFMVLPAIPEKRDPRTWWREHCHLFPRLYHVALKYLSIPATSAESERIFSLTGNILSPHRSTLSSQRLNQLVFLKHYQL
ncbi:RNA polymerase II regulatory region DNA binding [Balamuthia mandrillaris]